MYTVHSGTANKHFVVMLKLVLLLSMLMCDDLAETLLLLLQLKLRECVHSSVLCKRDGIER